MSLHLPIKEAHKVIYPPGKPSIDSHWPDRAILVAGPFPKRLGFAIDDLGRPLRGEDFRQIHLGNQSEQLIDGVRSLLFRKIQRANPGHHLVCRRHFNISIYAPLGADVER